MKSYGHGENRFPSIIFICSFADKFSENEHRELQPVGNINLGHSFHET
jgi:hypothetical protein